MRDKEWRSLWQERGSKATKEESQGSNKYELQDQPRSSNAFLFYQDVEKEIKNATAAKLEGFIAMKTRPITNSVSKWATQSRIDSRMDKNRGKE